MLRYFGTAFISAILAECVFSAKNAEVGEDRSQQEVPEIPLTGVTVSRHLQSFQRLPQSSVIQAKSISVNNANNMYFFITLYVGSNRQQLRFLLDTGSSYMWVPDNTCDNCKAFPRFNKQQSDTWEEQNSNGKAITYPQGLVFGQLGKDQVQDTDGRNSKLVIEQMDLLSVTQIHEGAYDGYAAEGVIGLQRRSTPDQSSQSNSPTFIQQLFDNGRIPKNMFSLQLKDARNSDSSNILIGDYSYSALRNFSDRNKGMSDALLDQLIQWSPVDQYEPFWAFQPNQIRMIMGSTDQVVASIGSSQQRTLVQLNSASAFLYMPSTLYEITKRYIEDELKSKCTFPGPDIENKPSLVCTCTPSQLELWPTIEVQVGSKYFAQRPKDYLIFDSEKTTYELQECVVKLRPLSESQDQNRWLLGNSFLRRYISIYDNSEDAALVGLFGGSDTPTRVFTGTITPAGAGKQITRRSRFVSRGQTQILIPFIVILLLVCCCLVMTMLVLEGTRQNTRNEKRIIPVEKNGKTQKQQAFTELPVIDEKVTLTVMDGHKPYTGPYPPTTCGHSPGRRHSPVGKVGYHEEKRIIIDRSKLTQKDFEGDIESLRHRIFENGQLNRNGYCQEPTLPSIYCGNSNFDRSLNDRSGAFGLSMTKVPMDTEKGGTLNVPSKGDKQFHHALKSKVEKEAGTRYNEFESVGFTTELVRDDGQNVIGSLYRVKYCIGGADHIHVRIFAPLATDTLSSPTLAVHGESPMPAVVQTVQKDQTAESPFAPDF